MQLIGRDDSKAVFSPRYDIKRDNYLSARLLQWLDFFLVKLELNLYVKHLGTEVNWFSGNPAVIFDILQQSGFSKRQRSPF